MTDFSDQYPYPKQYKTIHGKRMAYIDQGSGDPIVFLHGNPTSSYLWRNIMPYLEGRGRLIAPDLIGMGDSEKLDNTGADSYSYAEHQTYLYALLDELGVKENVTLVVHDWGSGLGFHWAKMNAHAVKCIAFMEAIVAPVPDWASFPEDAVELFKGFRSDSGEAMILDDNLFIEFVLPGMIMRTMTSAEMDEYRRPFARAGEDRRPTLTWPRQLPIAGEPEDVVKAVSAYSTWLSQTQIPKLFVNADPGVLITGAVRDYVRSWPNLSEVTVAGLHFIQEDSPHEIGQAIADWHSDLV